MDFSTFIWTLIIFGIPAAIVSFIVYKVLRNIRLEQEKKYAPFYERIEKFAQTNGFAVQRIPLYGRQATVGIRQYLPKDLPTQGKQKAVIPLYNDTEDYYGQYRSAFLLTKEHATVLWLPKYMKTSKEFFGVILHLTPMPHTQQWFTLWQEALFDIGKDQQLESRNFNDIFALHCSSPRLSTEIFTPEMMERFIAQREIRTYVRFKGSTAIVGQEADFSEDRVQTVIELAQELERRFLRAYTAHPEPVKK